MSVMLVRLVDWFERQIEDWRPVLEEKHIIKEHPKRLEEEIEEAHQQWLNAQEYFDNVTDPELIDHAIYMIKATKSKYMYLINKAKEI